MSVVYYYYVDVLIFLSKNLLLEHHGRVDDLILCKGAFTEANELQDEMQTLKGYGIKGAPRGVEPAVTVPLFYDFKPVAYDEPLLLVRYFVLSSPRVVVCAPALWAYFSLIPSKIVYGLRGMNEILNASTSRPWLSYHMQTNFWLTATGVESMTNSGVRKF